MAASWMSITVFTRVKTSSLFLTTWKSLMWSWTMSARSQNNGEEKKEKGEKPLFMIISGKKRRYAFALSTKFLWKERWRNTQVVSLVLGRHSCFVLLVKETQSLLVSFSFTFQKSLFSPVWSLEYKTRELRHLTKHFNRNLRALTGLCVKSLAEFKLY